MNDLQVSITNIFFFAQLFSESFKEMYLLSAWIQYADSSTDVRYWNLVLSIQIITSVILSSSLWKIIECIAPDRMLF